MSDDSNSSSRPSILLAGGRDLANLLDKAGFSGAGADVFVAGDGAGAICELLTNAYDAAVIDHSLPRVDGLRLIVLIRSTSKIAKLPIVVVLEEGDARARLEAARAGADATLMKPVEAADLEDSLERALAIEP